MEQVLTVVCKLEATPEQMAKLEATCVAFADACTYTNAQVAPKVMNRTAIHHEVYYKIRDQFGLSANLAVRACARVAANRKAAKKDKAEVGAFKPTSVDYDARIFSFREADWTVSLTTTHNRSR